MKPKLTKTQKRNLAKLTLYCWRHRRKLQGHFDMQYFAKDQNQSWGDQTSDDVSTPDLHTCGTTVCFCGFGPQAGIGYQKKETWQDYGIRVFGVDADHSEDLWEWLFSQAHENDLSAACRRAAWVLQGNEIHEFDDAQDVADTIDGFKPNWNLIKELSGEVKK